MSLRAAREKAGYSQGDVAKLLNINQSSVSLWESGRHRPRTAFLPKLAGFYGCSIDDLLTEQVPGQPQPVESGLSLGEGGEREGGQARA